MNASGRHNTCKSRGSWFGSNTECQATGGWVSNAYATYLVQWDRHWKRCVIPRNNIDRHLFIWEGYGSIGIRWACVGLVRWWGNGLPWRRSLGVLRGRSPTLQLRTVQTPTGGSSEEYWSMGGSLNQPYRVQEGGLMGCKLLL